MTTTEAAAGSARGIPRPSCLVMVAASTGGPGAFEDLVTAIGPRTGTAAVLAVLHGPAWMAASIAARLAAWRSLPVALARDGEPVRSGGILLAPGDRHLEVDAASLTARITAAPPENFVRPSADLLFRSGAAAFGPRSAAVILSGTGRDGAAGAAAVAAAGGIVLVQDPGTAVAGGMARAVLDLGIGARDLSLPEIAGALGEWIALAA